MSRNRRRGSVLLDPESHEFLQKAAPTNLTMNSHLLKAGFLKYQTFGLLKSWKKRYFYLLATCLEFLPDSQESGREPTRVFDFEPGTEVREMPKEGKPLRFAIERPGKATLLLEADNAIEKKQWIDAFKPAVAIANSLVLKTHTTKAIEQSISNLQQKLVYGHMKYEGNAFLRETEGKAADSSLARLELSYKAWLDKLTDENKSDCSVLIKNFEEALSRGRTLVAALWNRIEAQDFIEKYKAEALATELALEKGERELAAAKQYWEGAKRIVNDMKTDKRFLRKGCESLPESDYGRYIEDIRVFLDDLDENDTLKLMDVRLNKIGFRRRPSIVNSKVSRVDRALFLLNQIIKSNCTMYRGSTFMTTKKVNEVKNRLDTFVALLTEFKTIYSGDEDMAEKLLKFESAKNEASRRLEELSQRREIHALIDQVNKHANSAKLAIACRDYPTASNYWETANNVCEELLSRKLEGMQKIPDEMEDAAGDMSITSGMYRMGCCVGIGAGDGNERERRSERERERESPKGTIY